MTENDVLEVVLEALIMYIDDFSLIKKASLLSDNEIAADNGKLLIQLKNGEQYWLSILKSKLQIV